MKTFTTLLFLITSFIALAQDPVFVHTATASTISGDASFIDHPLLNNNPSAQLVVSHVWNPPGQSGIYNEHRTGLYYSSSQGKWSVYNEDSSGMVEGSSYFIYIEQSNEILEQVHSASTQGSSASYSVLNHPDLNGNPNANVVISTYYNPSSSRNDHNYGTWYDGANWNIYSEDASSIEFGDAFMVAIDGAAAQSMRHTATTSNISGNWSAIDHPLLNGNPDAKFVFTHNWGEDGTTSNVLVDKVLGAWYTGSNWAIYTEDVSSFPVDAEFDIIIYDPTLGTEEHAITNVTFAPNPMQNFITLKGVSPIKKITLFNMLGQEVKSIFNQSESLTIDVSELATGNYLAKVETDDATRVLKLVKQ